MGCLESTVVTRFESGYWIRIRTTERFDFELALQFHTCSPPLLSRYTTVDRGLRESRYLEGTHRFYRFCTPLRGRTHHLYRAAPFLLKRCNRNVTKKKCN